MNPIAAIIDIARAESREALGHVCPDFVERWLAANVLVFAKGSHGNIRLSRYEPSAIPYQGLKPWGRRRGL